MREQRRAGGIREEEELKGDGFTFGARSTHKKIYIFMLFYVSIQYTFTVTTVITARMMQHYYTIHPLNDHKVPLSPVENRGNKNDFNNRCVAQLPKANKFNLW